MNIPDLSQVKGSIGPREAEALGEELRQLAATRELALRDRAATDAENGGLSEALAALTFHRGQREPNGDRVLVLLEEDMREAQQRVAEFGIFPEPDRVIFRVRLAYPGQWEITNRKPTDADKEQFPIYEELPLSTQPRHWTAIVSTPKGLRIAEWTPEKGADQ